MRLTYALLMTLAVGVAWGARPVARWDVVPDQRFAGVFKAGVCAFHGEGVRVEFRIAGQLVHTAENPTLNDRTGVWEYWCPLDAAAYPDGPVTLDARAVPLAAGHASFDLPSLTLYANSHGSLTVAVTNWVDAATGADTNPGTAAAPYQTLAKAVKNTPAGGTVNLLPGAYSCNALGGGSARPYWTVVQAAPGVARDQVEIGPGRPGTQRLRWRGVTLFCDRAGSYTTILTGENGSHSVWLDDCKTLNKQGRWAADANVFGNKYVSYVTGGLTTELANGPGASLIRGHRIEKICSDAWTGSSKLVVNSVCVDINPGSTGAHPDFHQSYAVAPAWCQDVILYNVRGTACVSQGLFGVRLRDSAFVNVLFEKGETVMYSQYSDVMENVIFLHLTIVRQSWLWRASYAPTDVQVINGIFPNMTNLEHAGLRVDHNHFTDPSRVAGTAFTTGDPRFVDPDAKDFRIRRDAPAAGNGRPLQCVPADIDGRLYGDTPNRGCHAALSTGTVMRVGRSTDAPDHT